MGRWLPPSVSSWRRRSWPPPRGEHENFKGRQTVKVEVGCQKVLKGVGECFIKSIIFLFLTEKKTLYKEHMGGRWWRCLWWWLYPGSPSFVEVQNPPSCQGAWGNDGSAKKIWPCTLLFAKKKGEKQKLLEPQKPVSPKTVNSPAKDISYLVVFGSGHLSKWPPPRESRPRAGK